MNKSTLDLLLDGLANLNNRIQAIETAFIDYSEQNPKSSDQWREERLRAVEHQCKTLMDIYNQHMPANQVVKADLDFHEKAWKKYEPIIKALQADVQILNKHASLSIVRSDEIIQEYEARIERLEKIVLEECEDAENS